MKILRTAGLTAGVLLAGWVGYTSLETYYPSFEKAAPQANLNLLQSTVKKQVNKDDTVHVSSMAVAQPDSGSYVTSANLNVRSHPSTVYPVMGVVKQGSALIVQAKLSNGWYQISYHGKKAYVTGQYVVHQNKAAVYKMNVPIVRQKPELPTGCEVTSLAMALKYKGIKVDKITLAKTMPYTTTLDPNKGFVGSPFKTSGETINPVKLQVLAKAYRSKSADLTGASIVTIEKEVRAGNPVLVWYTMGYVYPKDEYLTRNGHKYWFPEPLHCIVVTGASSSSFYINDPLNGNKNYPITKERFNKIYTKMGKRALVVR